MIAQRPSPTHLGRPRSRGYGVDHDWILPLSLTNRIFKHILVESANRFFSSLALSAMAAPALRLLGASVGKNARIHTPLIFHNTKFSHLVIGENCHMGRDVFLDLMDRIEIGDNVTISMRVTLITHFDPGDSPIGAAGFPAAHAPVTIGEGVYIGAGATVLHSVDIGAGSVIAAGALVRRDVPPHSVIVGVPGRLIRTLDRDD